MFEERYHNVELASLLHRIWQTHQIDIGSKTINSPGKTVPPKWLLESMTMGNARDLLVTITPRTPYPERVVYKADGVSSWKSITSYVWTEEHPVNGTLFRLETSTGYRRYAAVIPRSSEWSTMRRYLEHPDPSVCVLEGYYVRDYDPIKESFRYYPAQEIADKAKGLVKGHRWHRRRYKAMRVFLELDKGGSHA